MKTTLIACNALLLATASTSAMAQEAASATALPPVNVDGAASPATVATAPATSTRITRDGLRNRQSSSSDTAALLGMVIGTAVLHLVGMGLGEAAPRRARWISAVAGAAVAALGSVLLLRMAM